MRNILAGILLLASLATAQAQDATFKFGGEPFVHKFETKGSQPNRQIEFGLADEPIEKWSKLVTIYSFPKGGNDAARAAAVLANLIRERHTGAKYKVITNPKTSEAIVDFLLPVANTELMEFNVFKYTPVGNELVALQFARRVKLSEVDGVGLREIRERAIKEMASYEMAPVKAFFGNARQAEAYAFPVEGRVLEPASDGRCDSKAGMARRESEGAGSGSGL